MAEAEVDPKFLNQNHTYFVPVDRSSPAPSDVANDVVYYIFKLSMTFQVLSNN